MAWFVAALAVGGIGTAVLISEWTGTSIGDLTRDPAAVTRSPIYIGFLSNLGIMVWTAAAAVCLFAACLIDGRSRWRRHRAFLAWSGGLTIVLALDDLYMFHEAIAPNLLGIPDEAVIGAYGLFTLGCLWAYRAVILSSDHFFLRMAAACFAVSLLIDVIELRGAFLLEDGAKFIGIAAWLSYFTGFAAGTLRQADARREAENAADSGAWPAPARAERAAG